MVETLHDSIAGRVRFRVKQIYRCDSLKYHLEHTLEGDPAVISAHANTLTSTILVRFNSGAASDYIRSLIERALAQFPGESALKPRPQGPEKSAARFDYARPGTRRRPPFPGTHSAPMPP